MQSIHGHIVESFRTGSKVSGIPHLEFMKQILFNHAGVNRLVKKMDVENCQPTECEEREREIEIVQIIQILIC